MADMSDYEELEMPYEMKLYREVIEDLQDIILPKLRIDNDLNLWEEIELAAKKLKKLYTNRYQLQMLDDITEGERYEDNHEIMQSVYGDDDV